MFDVCAGVRLLGSGSALPLLFETVRGSFVVLLALSLRLAPPELTRFTCRIGGNLTSTFSALPLRTRGACYLIADCVSNSHGRGATGREGYK